MEGKTIENYKIEKLLGQGGMGAVYSATDTSLDRLVALKIMNPGVATNADFLRRFKSEARVLGRLQHPNIVNVYTFRHVESLLIIVMEYVGGGTLSDLIDQHGAVPVRKATELIKQSLNALDFAHSSNIIHRDIKPPNILLTEHMQVKVSDFGLAKIQEDSNATMVTRVGMTGGTLHYMPPEQTEALSNVDHRGDIYSLGMTFYQMLAGRVPFDRNSSAFSVLRAIDQQNIPTPDSFNKTIPKALVEIVMKSIKKFPDERYQSAAEMRAAIEQFESGAAQPAAGEFMKTAILSQPPVFSSPRQPSSSSQNLYQKNKASTGHDEKFAVGSRSSSKVKKAKRSSKVSKAGKAGNAESNNASKKWVAVLGILVLAASGFFLLPRFFSSSPDTGIADTTVTDNGTDPSTSNAGGDSQPMASESDNNTDLSDNNGASLGGNEPTTITPLPPETSPTSSDRTDNTPPPVVPQVQTRTVRVESNPSGASVFMDGREVGQTPLNIPDVRAESHDFSFRLEGYQGVNQSLDVARQTVLSVDLVPFTGQVRIIVRPFGDILIDGTQKASGSNGWFQDELPVGTHTITARHPALGSWDKQVTIRAGGSEEVRFDFAQEYIVTVTSQPSNAEILVDGEPVMTSRGPMTTPRQLRLPPGNHTINVRLQGFRVSGGARNIVLEEDMADPLFFSLVPQ